jgi:Rad3-related DNA helicase
MTYLIHPLDRPGQQAAFDFILNSQKKYIIINAPTGSGKSAWAAEMSKHYRTLVLTEHKSLQSTNYRDQYQFDILYGKSNYPCEDKERKKLHWTCFDCGNPDCQCPYNLAEMNCLKSLRVSLNYAKFLMSGDFVDRYNPEILFLDEGHNVPDIVTEFIGFGLEWKNEFIKYLSPPEPMRLTFSEAMHIFKQCLGALEKNKPKRPETNSNLSQKDVKYAMEKWRKWKHLKQKLEITAALLEKGEPLDWYFEAEKEKLIIKPLTAKYHFKRMFDAADKVVLMSATIKPSIAEELGIGENEFDYYEVPHIWPAPLRLVHDLGCPRMNWESTDYDKGKQAEIIAKFLSRSVSGIIHVSSKAQAAELKEKLNYHGFDIWLPPDGQGTDEQLQAWYEARRPGMYCISWNFHEGVDLGNDAINIIAKIPYTNIGSGYEYAKMEYNQQAYLERAAYRLEQASGRNRRGEFGHYQPGARFVAIADGAWHRLKSLLSVEYVKSIRKWNGK